MCHIIVYIQDFVFEIGGFLGKLGQMIDMKTIRQSPVKFLCSLYCWLV